MLIGYCRVSTLDQQAGYEAQLRDLQSQGCEKIFGEQVSSVNAHRAELERAIEFVREGDRLVVTKLDRLARSVADWCQIVARLEAKKVGLIILGMNVDTATPTGRLMLNMLGSIAQFERELMLERQREGIAKAKAEHKFKGRAPTARRKTSEIVSMHRAGKKPSEIAKAIGVGRSSVYRILADEAA
ncbi:recombinase family protein [Mesorhizobium sp. M4A.F.Ca.ET.050.02.1.1]|uniref:recombinase family protein n=1 Tax=unclassified Mesorhizobium TaxID=325217 RepID=UPI000FCBC07D|nr:MULTISPECIES: recombinase family protein [unclassified Mesorhizobium]RUX49779.1 recombinase family protein [Mesorhizobium sp. M4A.F.Ca.ET.050.02.1.1]RWD36103.1 MAG: recombinase family protein [Mesorhizobium sp.]TIT73827.1 MAG: recombinase family protein [Mesorhizobium sp.]